MSQFSTSPLLSYINSTILYKILKVAPFYAQYHIPQTGYGPGPKPVALSPKPASP